MCILYKGKIIHHVVKYFVIIVYFAGQPFISSITFKPLTGALTCVSSGGPASEFTWSRSGPQYQEHQQIGNTTTATYLNIQL